MVADTGVRYHSVRYHCRYLVEITYVTTARKSVTYCWLARWANGGHSVTRTFGTQALLSLILLVAEEPLNVRTWLKRRISLDHGEQLRGSSLKVNWAYSEDWDVDGDLTEGELRSCNEQLYYDNEVSL